MDWGADRWRLYRLAVAELWRALWSRAVLVLRWPWRAMGSPPERLLFAPQDLRTRDPTVASDIYAGIFVFAGRAVNTGGRSPFDCEPPSQAWAEGLYGFSWLRHLRAAATALARANARVLVDDFIVHGDRTGTASRTHVVARRLISFLAQSPLLLEDADRGFYRRMMRALGRSIRELEHELRASATSSARLSAAIALCYAGLCCDRHGGLLRRASRALARELDRQILPDGGHASRNPRALIDLLLDLLPLRETYVSRGVEPPPALLGALERMPPMLRLFRHGDGTLARFNGVGATPADHLATVLVYDETRGEPMRHAPDSGYERLEAGTSVLIVDAGGKPPLEQSREAHAGCLSFEFSSGPEGIVVNCGMTRSPKDPGGLAARATAAHSTATIGETSSCRFLAAQGWWGDRKLAAWLERRLGPVVLRGPETVASERRDTPETLELSGSHDGYRPRFGILHERRWRLSRAGNLLVGEDAFTHEAGAAAQDVAIRFHLHPGVQAQDEANGGLTLQLAGGATWRFEASPVVPRLDESVYFAIADRPRRTEQIVLALRTDETPAVRWRLERVSATPGDVAPAAPEPPAI